VGLWAVVVTLAVAGSVWGWRACGDPRVEIDRECAKAAGERERLCMAKCQEKATSRAKLVPCMRKCTHDHEGLEYRRKPPHAPSWSPAWKCTHDHEGLECIKAKAAAAGSE
jgi:hypothetical protein